MSESFLDGKVTLLRGDCLERLRELDENSIDSAVTDPPYHLTSIVKRFGAENAAPAKNGKTGAYARASKGFMGKQWDGGDIAFNPLVWELVFRALKPGAHLLAFSGTRTYHRMACAIEDAGFEIRDQIGWAYGSGFPKSHDVSKAIDRMAGAEREIIGTRTGVTVGDTETYSGAGKCGFAKGEFAITAAATEHAVEWQGWGTALKPAWEPIVVARKPLSESSIAANVLKHGTGAINIDGCRVEAEVATGWGGAAAGGNTWNGENCGLAKDGEARPVNGRWPANLIHDGSEEVVERFPQTESGSRSAGQYGGMGYHGSGDWPMPEVNGDSGSAARFFYTAKADSDDRLGSKHPTVKPLDLIQYLARLVTPRGGTILDPFAGTGTTGEAAFREGFCSVLIEREPEYQADIVRRMGLCLAGPDERNRKSIEARGLTADAGPLFGGGQPC